MSGSKIRTSLQVLIDQNLDVNYKKLINVAEPTTGSDGATKQYVDNVASGVGSALHSPVADLTTAKAVGAVGRSDKMLMNIETMGLFRFDAESTDTSNDITIIRPTDISSDASAGRWIKMSSSLNDHNNLSNIQGGAAGDYYHLTSAEKTEATRSASATQRGLLSSTDFSAFNSKLGASNFVNREVPSGNKNGSNTVYTLANTPISGSESVYLNGMLMNAGVGNDYTISSNTITFASAPVSTDVILVSYQK